MFYIKRLNNIFAVAIGISLLSSCYFNNINHSGSDVTYTVDDLPPYSGSAYVELNNGYPSFDNSDKEDVSFESYSELDYLGRCGSAYASLSTDTMPTQKRESISHIKPSGWQSVQYDFVEGESLYNRCHLIGFQLSGENDNELNLITGTRYMNVEGMLPFENMVAEYIDDTGNHVLYRVTPVYEGNNLVADGVVMEALSVEDNGKGICYNVYCYNVQPGVSIDYATGYSYADGTPVNDDEATASEPGEYVLNNKSKKFHYPSCSGAQSISSNNKSEYSGTREELIKQGYDPCRTCDP